MTGLYKYVWAAAFALLSLATAAQPRVEAKLDTVPRDGFYRVWLQPDLARYAQHRFADLRLRNAKGEPVPYRIDTAREGYSTFGYPTYFPLLSVQHDSDRSTLIFEVPTARSSGFALELNNSEAQRRVSISGSNDRNQWYSLRENFLLAPLVATESVLGRQNISYPLSDYRYVRLVLFNGREAPLEPKMAYTYATFVTPPKWLSMGRLPARVFDSSGSTYVRIGNPGRVRLERLRLDVSRPRFFARNVTVTEGSKGRLLASMAVTESQRELQLEVTKAPELLLRIERGDNPSLQVDSITGEQRAYTMLTYLEKGRTYTLSAGDSKVIAPVYDLSGFRSPATDSAATIGYGPLRILPEPAAQKERDNRIWIWIALGVGILVLGWFSYSLLRDVQREQS
ncbi:MAG: DUF3999 family protein [Sphingobacteriales bacterium]|nr:MAG: DUF3999 family protein [Sphingobacteriales bacterium]